MMSKGWIRNKSAPIRGKMSHDSNEYESATLVITIQIQISTLRMQNAMRIYLYFLYDTPNKISITLKIQVSCKLELCNLRMGYPEWIIPYLNILGRTEIPLSLIIIYLPRVLCLSFFLSYSFLSSCRPVIFAER